MATNNETTKLRNLSEIAEEIRADWGDKMYFGAHPYVSAMFTLNDLSESYGYDSADSVVRYFLANAQSWRGETARRVKAELKERLKNGR